jgi:hypothetical protein
MTYTLGVSSGIWGAARGEELLGLVRKIEWTLTKGVTHTQLDLETIAEFKDPDLDNKIKRYRDVGVTFGIHAESYATLGGRDTLPLTSALEAHYDRAHIRLIDHLAGSGRIGAKYVTLHTADTEAFIRLGESLQPTRLVDIWGRPLPDFLKEHPELVNWAIRQKPLTEIYMGRKYHNVTIEDLIQSEMKRWEETHEGQKITKEKEQEIKKEAEDFFKKELVNSILAYDISYGPERIAYYITAKWMQNTGHPLWKSIVGKNLSDQELFTPPKFRAWVPAVACLYLWGHFNPKRNDLVDPKQFLEKYKMYFFLETTMAGAGIEGDLRLAKLAHLYAWAKFMKNPWVCYAVDMEHLLSNNLDPAKEIKELPSDGAVSCKMIHITYVTALNPAHVTIPVGSEMQYYIYERLWELRQKGFKDGWFIFERTGGEDPIKQSVIAMRLIKEFLEKEVKPTELPLDFFGMKDQGPETARQQVAVKEHFMDPLKGMLEVPEEEYTFLSSAAVRKGKGEEWKKEKYR